ncbi:MAG: glycosyltransferase [Blastocatellia bacterium]
MATICLNMIVKNEANTIRRCFDSLKSIIDYWVIVDTGSTDGTQEIIRSFTAEVPGELHERPWVNFGHNRTEGMQLADGKADYLLLMDADNALRIVDPHCKQSLTADAYHLQILGSVVYWQTRLVKSGLQWHSVGVTHEYPHSLKAQSWERLEALQIVDYFDGGARDDKYERDIRLLTQGLIDEPNNERYIFYLAQSYRQLNELEKAIEWYEKRVAAGGWREEVWLSLYSIGQLHMQKNADESTVLKAMIAAYEYDPSRCEPLYELCRYYRMQERYHLGLVFGLRAIQIAYPEEAMNFVVRGIYDWMRYDELSVCEYWTGDYTASARHAAHCLGKTNFAERERIQKNLEFALQKLAPLEEK